MTTASRSAKSSRQVRYAVVGLGHIAQTAVLPAFANAKRNSVLTALVSEDETKLKELGDRYQVERFRSYDDCLESGKIDAVYIAHPNHLHCEFAVRAAEAGVHILCEKPMAVTAAECEKMIHAAEAADVRLMIAYRLHFEKANLKAIEIARSRQLGELRMFSSTFAINVVEGNVRLQSELGGGTLYDIGVYCINAARYLFGDEPTEVFAMSGRRDDPRFAEVDEATTAILRFPGDRLATFTSSFGCAETGSYQLCGTKGNLRVDPAYDYFSGLTHYLTIEGKTQKKTYRRRDQFGPELAYFSDCVLQGTDPEPNGREGLIDVAIVEALYASARAGEPIQLQLPKKHIRPSGDQSQFMPPVKEPELVHAGPPQPE
jgi:predicted dehydrogenase